MRPLRRLTVLIVIAIVTILFMTAVVLSAADDEPRYLGKPFSYWLWVIQNRDEQLISLAFDAVRGLGPQARAAPAHYPQSGGSGKEGTSCRTVAVP